jgi:uncharacterized protein YndB with AHSA1/START domain
MTAPVTEVLDETAVMIRRTFNADIETLFTALTNPEAWMQWFGGGKATPIKTGADVSVGGAWHIDMRGGDGSEFGVSGEYIELDPPSRVSFTWAWSSKPGKISQVTYALSPAGNGKTTLTLTHAKLPDAETRDSHAAGWNATFDLLDKALAA